MGVLPEFRERLGFTHEALKRRAMRFDNVYYDAAAMCLVMKDPK